MKSTNNTNTAPAQDGQLLTGEFLVSGSAKYLVHSFLGHGSFGRVAKCIRMMDGKTVAIKMIKAKGDFKHVVQQEMATLRMIKSLDLNQYNIVEWHHSFFDKGHVCLEFELLDKSLYDFMMQRNLKPLPLKDVRAIVQQIATALDHLNANGIVHADLTLQNVMLVDHLHQPFRVKVIDFGHALGMSPTLFGSYIQSQNYRSPEIILQLPYTKAIDIWSLGCMAAELYHGTTLYPGGSEYEMMKCIVDTQGQPSDDMLHLAWKTHRFFLRNDTNTCWKLKTPEQYYTEFGIEPKEHKHLTLSSLDDLLQVHNISPDNSADAAAECIDGLLFVDMLRGMLQLDATMRLAAPQVLQHPFVSMQHIESMYYDSNYVQSSFRTMEVCNRKIPTSDDQTVVRGSVDQQPSGTGLSGCSSTCPLQHNANLHPAGNAHRRGFDELRTKGEMDGNQTSVQKTGNSQDCDHRTHCQRKMGKLDYSERDADGTRQGSRQSQRHHGACQSNKKKTGQGKDTDVYKTNIDWWNRPCACNQQQQHQNTCHPGKKKKGHGNFYKKRDRDTLSGEQAGSLQPPASAPDPTRP